ncbi:MAG TPA: hypothetical protein DEB39_13055, partial [Planctomycetaceae bacterium]|nr:hypothetical protein [Planctomycetaceae bacterium]
MCVATCVVFVPVNRAEDRANDVLARAKEKLREENLPKEALESLRPWSLDPGSDPDRIGEAVPLVVEALARLNRINEADEYLEKTAAVHARNGKVLHAVAMAYVSLQHFGHVIDNRFVRGNAGTGQWQDSRDRDRARALSLMRAAEKRFIDGVDNRVADNSADNSAAKPVAKRELGEFYLDFAACLLWQREGNTAWRLQTTTDLESLPDYDAGNARFAGGTFAPVDSDGNPVCYTLPETFESARSDGQRWRWCLDRAANAAPELLGETLFERARFNDSQFGVETLRDYPTFFGYHSGEGADTDDAGAVRDALRALDTLTDDETIAKLADGVKRFTLPGEFNPIALCKRIVDENLTAREEALTALAEIMENRRQFPRSAAYWRQLLEDYPTAVTAKRTQWRERLDQIVKNRGTFEAVPSNVAGRGTDLRYRFRNGKNVVLSAREIKIPELIADIKSYLRSLPKRTDWSRLRIDQIGYRLISDPENYGKYLGREVA